MNRDERLIAVLGLAGVAWYLYQSSRGLTVTGEQVNPMIPLGRSREGQVSNVTPSSTTSTAATNVFSAIGNAVAGVLGSVIRKGPGNSPVIVPPTPVGVNVNGIPGQASGFSEYLGAAQPIAPYLVYSDPTNAIYWPPLERQPQPCSIQCFRAPCPCNEVDALPIAGGVPTLGWTLDPALVL